MPRLAAVSELHPQEPTTGYHALPRGGRLEAEVLKTNEDGPLYSAARMFWGLRGSSAQVT
jgi:hypothetical protein